MGWITFLASESRQKIELHTASQGGSGTELPVISIGIEDPDATEERWSHFVTQPAKVDSPMQRMIHHEDAETVFG
jgi:hypothetical protein